MHAKGNPPSPVPEQEALEREEDLRLQRRLMRIQQWHAQCAHAQTHDAYAESFPINVEILAKEDIEALRQECLLRRFPRLLLARGAVNILSRPTVAIVGSRAPTLYGRRMAALFGSELAKEGITVLSGGALGVDGIANKAALAHGATCAIVGGGLFCAHPRTNHPLFEAMAHSGRGLLLSQFPEHEWARPWHFPCRNQTIAQLADFILVIEASPKSGSLITAEAALDAGRDLGALPGDLENPLSRGTNALIADGAFCIRSPQEVLERVSMAHRMRKNRLALFEGL